MKDSDGLFKYNVRSKCKFREKINILEQCVYRKLQCVSIKDVEGQITCKRQVKTFIY